MNTRGCLLCLSLGIFLLAGCTSKKPSSPPPSSSASTQPSATSTEPAQQSQSVPAPAPATPAPVAAAPAAEPPPKPPAPKPVVIPRGTILTVRLEQALGSKSSRQGDRFKASLSKPVVVKGKTIIPVGAKASGTVTDAHAAGRFKGGAILNITLDSVDIHGIAYPIQTMALAQTSKGKGKRTARMIGGGTGVGALIGGIAGGGEGAGIGALVGAGASTAGAGLTGNRDITLPAESAISFQMTTSMTLKARPVDSTGAQ